MARTLHLPCRGARKQGASRPAGCRWRTADAAGRPRHLRYRIQGRRQPARLPESEHRAATPSRRAGAAALAALRDPVRGLHFIGPAAANSFGPVSRFVYGTHHPSRHLAHHLAMVLPRVPSRTTGHPVQLDVSPEFVPERRVSRFPGGGRVRCYHELPVLAILARAGAVSPLQPRWDYRWRCPE